MAQPTKYDVVLNGRKYVGAAQRKTKRGFLHQGTIAIEKPDFDYLDRVVRSDTQVVEAMKLHTHTLSVSRDQVKQLLIQQFISHAENSHHTH